MESYDISNPLLEKLPKDCIWGVRDVYKLEGFWYPIQIVQSILAFQSHFEARDDDVFLASSMKTGTTWLKALCFCILGEQNGCDGKDPLLENIPHTYVQTMENQVYIGNGEHVSNLSSMMSPRLFHTHLPYSALPNSIKNSECKIVYITRNPKDTFMSMSHFLNSVLRPNQDPFPLERALENFCNGVHQYGSFFDHVLQYWNESLKKPRKMMFLKYEDLKRDPKGEVKRLALFLGRPDIKEEEIDKVLWRCSFGRLKNLEVNKNGISPWKIPNNTFFRLGVVGDWKKHLTPEMEHRIDQIARTKLEGSGLVLEDQSYEVAEQ